MTNASATLEIRNADMSSTTSDIDSILRSIPGLYRGPGGAIAVVKDGKVQGQHVWGFADLDRRIPMTSTTHLPICSISKQMLCLVIADLAHNPTALMKKNGGDFDSLLATELAKALPALAGHKDGELTIANLYNMQSGIRDYWGMTVLWGAKPDDPFSLAWDAPRTLERTKSFHFAPGTEFSYSNVNFHVLARIVEKVSGHSLRQLLAERVFIPAGMSSASLDPNTAGPPLPIVGYEGTEKSGYFPALNRLEWSGDAGIVATLEDMIAYEQYLDASWEDTQSNYRVIAEPQVYKDGAFSPYSHGLLHDKTAGKTTIGHSGGLRGFRLQRMHVPEERLSVVVMFNHEVNPIEAAEHILKQMLDAPEAAKSATKPGPEWKGFYLDADTQLVLEADVREGELFVMGEKLQLSDAYHGTNAKESTFASLDGDMLELKRTRDNRTYRAKRLTKPTTPPKSDVSGEYRCDEVESTIHVTGDGEVLYASFAGFLGHGPIHLMKCVGEDVWLVACPRSLDAPAPGNWTCVFRRGGDGQVKGVTVGTWLARGLEFVRKS